MMILILRFFIKKNRLKKFSIFFLFFLLFVIFSAFGLAAPTIPGFYGSVTPPIPSPSVNTLPALRSVVQGATVPGASNNRLVIHQNRSKAILEWDSFDIGENASTHFDQQGNTGWAALNRIFDKNPSRIFGALTADGKIYLINRNGILFSPSSRVNVHSLVASSLNIKDNDFLEGLLKFKTEDYNNPDDNFIDVNSSVVSNHGVIETDRLGSVFLLAPTVENSGVIIAPTGRIGLVAGTEVDLPHYDVDRKELPLKVNETGEHGLAVNFENGWLIAETGLAGMYGRVVNQKGLIRSVTAVKKEGGIELLASEKVSTGANSLTVVSVSSSLETAHQSFEITKSEITIAGLDDPVKRIEHRGVIRALSGNVGMEAEERVFLEKGSVTDVSGMWGDKSGETNFIEVQLNSVQLRDDYGQKDGLLQGEIIAVDALAGSAIGDISGHLIPEEMTALERSTEGGNINISVSSGDIIIKEGAMIDFSGGGIRYGESAFRTTRLLAGNRIYDISEAPQWIQYDRIMGYQEKQHERYGIAEQYEGIYYGGANSLNDYSPGYIEGSDAGSLMLVARTVVLDGMLDGSVVPGIYQTEASEPKDEYGNQTKRGYKEPRGGILTIGLGSESVVAYQSEIDRVVHEIVVQSDPVPISESFGPEDDLLSEKTYLSAELLKKAGLSGLGINANTKITVEKNALISLNPGGTFSARARSIEHKGDINVPSGEIYMGIMSNVTADNGDPCKERLYLSGGSRITAAGEKIDNTMAGTGMGGTFYHGHIEGGVVSLMDKTFDEDGYGEGVIIHQGALVDVSGGYEISGHGEITGGNAGLLNLQGPILALEGELRGHSLVGQKGGTISLHAQNASVKLCGHFLPGGFTFDSEVPDEFKAGFILSHNRLDGTGFTQIELNSQGDLAIEEGVILSPSRTKLANPAYGKNLGLLFVENYNSMGDIAGEGLIKANPDYIGFSSVKLSAGSGLDLPGAGGGGTGKLVMAPGTKIEVDPGGEINLKGDAVDMGGALEAPSGSVSLVATLKEEDSGAEHALILRNTGRISAAGYNRQKTKTLVKGLPAGFTPMPGGEVALKAKSGDLFMEQGSLIDVSGSASTTNFVWNSSGGFSSVIVAGDPGSIELAYFGNITLDGLLKGHARLDGLRGGRLAISRKNYLDGIPLTIRADDINRYQADGFDALTFQSLAGLNFSGSMNIKIGRSLTLDAPEITGENGRIVSLAAPWLRLANTEEKYPKAPGMPDPYSFIPEHAESGTGTITLSGDWLDIDGSVTLSKFKDVNLYVRRDIRLADEIYRDKRKGMLKVPGDLTLMAARIYPATYSDFTIKAAGTVNTLSTGMLSENPIYSAGGSLAIEANKINHQGILAAPMGSVSLRGMGDDSRVYLADGSVISTRGDVPVKYGYTDEIFWIREDKENPNGTPIPVEKPPEKSINIACDNEIIVREGAKIDTSGGGSVFSYLFLPGIEGSNDPLKREETYVVVPGIHLPGNAVYLEGTDALPAGVYSLLSEEYAFLPGAFVITDRSELERCLGPVKQVFSEEGYSIVSGYSTVAGTDIRSSWSEAYTLRSASEVLKEGGFIKREFIAGNAGSIVVSAPTTILDGTIIGEALPGYQGGLLSLSAAANAVVRSSVSLPPGFGFEDVIPGDFVGECTLSSYGLAGRGLRELKIGDFDTTETITLEDGSILDAPLVTLSATDTITLESGARIEAVGDGGTASLISPDGEVIIRENALVHASDAVNLETSNLTLEGKMKVDDSRLNLKGKNIAIVSDGYTGDKVEETIYLTESLWGLTGFDNIGFISENDLTFLGDVDLEVAEELTLDAKRIAGLEFDGGNTSSITSQTINLLNTKEAFDGAGLDNDTCIVAFNADEMSIGHGNLLFDGFGAVNLNSTNDLTFKGEGSLISSGDLNMSAARVATSYYQETETSYEVARFQVDAGDSAININKSGGIAKDTKIPGGSLEFLARKIDHSGTIDVTSGRVKFIATGSGTDNGIFLQNGSQILVRGCDYAPGGLVDLQTEQGALNIETGSLIDVSAGGQGDAGAISLYAPAEGVLLNGTLTGEAQGGKGGSFALDTNQVNDFSTLNAKLAEGGFNEEVNIRTRGGDVTIAAGDTVLARHFKLTVDKTEGGNDGNINLSGEIDASGNEGGMVALYAGNDLNLDGRIDAHSSRAGLPGGEVSLNAADGTLNFNNGSSIDVSAGEGGEGGKISFRAMRNVAGDDVKMNLNGTITGTFRITAEAVKEYFHTGDFTITSSYINDPLKTDAQSFMNHADTIKNRLFTGPAADEFHLLPGMKIQSAGDLTLAYTWDLTSLRYDNEPGVITLRAAGDLNINSDLVDHPTDRELLFPGDSHLNSWGINLIAGADLQSADIMAIDSGTGDLKIGDNKVVYTESALIRFASGNDTVIGRGYEQDYMINKYMAYNLATCEGSIRGRVGRDLSITERGGTIQSAAGDIDIDIGRDLVFGNWSFGAIRTTGRAPEGFYDYWGLSAGAYWEFADGGDIRLDVGGEVLGCVIESDYAKWDKAYTSGDLGNRMWAADYGFRDGYATTGIATMGGGDIEVRTGGDFCSQIGTFGQGSFGELQESDLTIHAGGNLDGRFLIRNGSGEFHAMGSFGLDPEDRLHDIYAQGRRHAGDPAYEAIEAFDAGINLSAQGSIDLGAVVNPTIAREDFTGLYFLYTEDTFIKLKAVTGDVSILGQSRHYSDLWNTEKVKYQNILPPVVEIYAPDGNINIANNFVIAPSHTGNLVLEAGGDINGLYSYELGGSTYTQTAMVIVSDLAPAAVYSRYKEFKALSAGYYTIDSWKSDSLYSDGWDENIEMSYNNLNSGSSHAEIPIHLADDIPVSLNAGHDIRNLKLFLPKKAYINAGRDIRDIYLQGQNIATDDMALVKAGRNLFFSTASGSAYRTGIEYGGPGCLMVQAGNSIDLGTTEGIQSIANYYNDGLSPEGCSVAVISGYNKDWQPEELEVLFNDLRDAGMEYAELLQKDSSLAMEKIKHARKEIIKPFFQGSSTGDGNIDMIRSRIKTVGEESDIFIIASGDFNVGKSSFTTGEQQTDTGVYTEFGGEIKVFTVGDINVLESRVMTMYGGDIVAWSDEGNINAGRGSKTATNRGKPIRVWKDDHWEIYSKPASKGSGILTRTYDLDGFEGPLKAPQTGDAYIFAPQGIIDAGEAGISAGNVTLGATEIVNAQNIEVTGISVGVPVASEGVSGLGALAGVGSLAETNRLTENVTGLDAGKDASKVYEDEPEAFTPTWLDVKVVGFDKEK